MSEKKIIAAYMLDGRLYVKHDADTKDEKNKKIVVKRDIDDKGQIVNEIIDAVPAASVTDEGYTEYFSLIKADRVLFSDGKYSLGVDGIFYPVVSLACLRVTNPQKICVSQNPKQNGMTIPFYDDVFAVLHNGAAYDGISFAVTSTPQSIDASQWPDILSKAKNAHEPLVLSEIPADAQALDKNFSLDHGDMLTLQVGNTIYVRYWDQISKLWYQVRTYADKIDMVDIKGGSFLMGDPDGNLGFCNYPAYPINIKKLWQDMCDPQFMGETARGEAAVGVSGLNPANSTAVSPDSPFWQLNDDATPQFPVHLDDYMLGKFTVTMEQYYNFVDNLAEDGDVLFYEIGNERHYINEIAAVALRAKKLRVIDGGWGMGQRPAIDIVWFEALEYCNWLSRREGLPVCYSFILVYDGKESAGKTQLECLTNVAGSSIAKENTAKQLQIYDVRCDFAYPGYRLPTEAEFEYAAKGGSEIPYIRGGKGYAVSGSSAADATDKELVNNYACWSGNTQNPSASQAVGLLFSDNMGANGYTSPVGSKLPNNLGIYDMSGNVWETVWNYYSLRYDKNPAGPVYTALQLSVLAEDCDEVLNGEYSYGYEIKDGLKKRVSCQSLSGAGRFAHTLRGGCWANPYLLIRTSNRFVGVRSYTGNSPLFSDARIGFRLARTKKPDVLPVFSKIKEIILLHYHECAADFEPVGEEKELFTLSEKSQELTMGLYEDGDDFFYNSVQDIQVVEIKDKAAWKRFMAEPKPYRDHRVRSDTLFVEQTGAGLYRAVYLMDVLITGRGELHFRVTMNFKLDKDGELKILNCLQETLE